MASNGPNYTAVLAIKSYIDSNLETYVQQFGQGLTAPESVMGERNAFGLSKYPAVMFVPGPVYPYFSGNYGYEAELEIYLGIAVTDAKPATLVEKLWHYIDAAVKLVMADPTLGGTCLGAEVDDVEPIYGDPQAKNVGLAILTMRATVETQLT
jgi:hypothetical protein